MLRMVPAAILRSTNYTAYAENIHHHHADCPHWFLQFLGVAPESQGKGYASTLVRPLLARLDKYRIPSFLETQNEVNVPLYQHFGFEVVEAGMVPGTGVGHWAMLRKRRK